MLISSTSFQGFRKEVRERSTKRVLAFLSKWNTSSKGMGLDLGAEPLNGNACSPIICLLSLQADSSFSYALKRCNLCFFALVRLRVHERRALRNERNWAGEGKLTKTCRQASRTSSSRVSLPWLRCSSLWPKIPELPRRLMSITL